jgi:regulation of enolase protein 1 (concanavalin A-like superfamily)
MYRKLVYSVSFILVLGLVGASIAQEVDPNLVGWWKLDEGSGTIAYDSSSYFNDGTLRNGPQWVAGRIGGALDLDGTNDYVDCGNSEVFDITEQITLSVWVKPEAAGNNAHQHYLGKGNNAYCIKHNSWNNLEVVIYIGGWKVATFPLDDSYNGLWYHFAGTYDGSQIKLYINGALIATTDQTGAINTNTNNAQIGTRDGGQWFYNGVIDDARIYNRALSDDEIKKLGSPAQASNISPGNGALINESEVTLEWEAGFYADSHDVYFGEDFTDVNNATVSTPEIYKGQQVETQYPADGSIPVELGKTYYWRIDEVEADGVTVHTGAAWSFTISAKLTSNPAPSNDARLVAPDVTLSWTAGSGAISHNVYFGTDSDNLPLASEAQTETTYQKESLDYNTTYYWRVDEFDGTDIYTGDLWSFKTTPDIQITDPNLVGWFNFNADEGDIAVDWSGYGNHGNIFGNPNRVDGYDLGALEFDGIDDYIEIPQLISTDLTIMGWIKTLTPGAEGATGRDGSGLFWSDYAGGGDHFLVAVLGTKLAFETGPGGNPNTTSIKDVVKGEWVHVAITRAESTKNVEIFIDGAPDATGVHSGDNNVGSNPLIAIGANLLDSRYFTGLIDEVRFYDRVLTQEEIEEVMITNPAIARKSSPANGATPDIEHISILSWTPGENAAQHDVYFGTDANAVENADTSDATGIYQGRQDPNTYTLTEAFEIGQTYYWRIDEIDTGGMVNKGRVWSFTVANYLVVDDFEDYGDINNRIFDVWADYYVNNTGMTVGHFDPPFTETFIVHGGSQSMYMRYDNDGTVNEGTNYEKSGTLFYSEAEREWVTPQDWTRRGVDSLSLWFRGIPASVGSFTIGPPITMTGAGADIWDTSDQFHFAYRRLSGLGSITAKVLSMTNTHNSAKAGVMIRESLEPDAAHAMVAIQPMNEVQLLYRSTKGNISEAIGQSDVSTPVWVKLNRNGNTITGEYSVDNANWQTLGQAVVPMLADVYIGLIVCSHDNNATCTAEFSDVATTGTVTGDWQSQDIGVESNRAEQLYVVVQDSAGKSAVVNNPDTAATTFSDWTEWNISLTGFTGVNLQAVKSLAIGVGDRANPQAGGAGTLYIDDIWLMIP